MNKRAPKRWLKSNEQANEQANEKGGGETGENFGWRAMRDEIGLD